MPDRNIQTANKLQSGNSVLQISNQEIHTISELSVWLFWFLYYGWEDLLQFICLLHQALGNSSVFQIICLMDQSEPICALFCFFATYFHSHQEVFFAQWFVSFSIVGTHWARSLYQLPTIFDVGGCSWQCFNENSYSFGELKSPFFKVIWFGSLYSSIECKQNGEINVIY